jgi:hypothetical protein
LHYLKITKMDALDVAVLAHGKCGSPNMQADRRGEAQAEAAAQQADGVEAAVRRIMRGGNRRPTFFSRFGIRTRSTNRNAAFGEEESQERAPVTKTLDPEWLKTIRKQMTKLEESRLRAPAAQVDRPFQERYIRMQGLDKGDAQYQVMGLYEAVGEERRGVWRLIRTEDVKLEKATIVRPQPK